MDSLTDTAMGAGLAGDERATRRKVGVDAAEELAAIARAGIADRDAGRFVTVTTGLDADDLQARFMARLQATLAGRNRAA